MTADNYSEDRKALALVEAELDSPVLDHRGDVDISLTAAVILDSLWTTFGLDAGFAIQRALLPQPSDQMGLGPCAGCGHDPSCGFASTDTPAAGQQWWCHTDDHSCFAPTASELTTGLLP